MADEASTTGQAGLLGQNDAGLTPKAGCGGRGSSRFSGWEQHYLCCASGWNFRDELEGWDKSMEAVRDLAQAALTKYQIGDGGGCWEGQHQDASR